MSASKLFGNFNYPSRYHLGCGRIRELPTLCQERAVRRPLVVTDPGIVGLSWFAPILRNLEDHGLRAAVHSGVQSNPVQSDVDSGVETYRSGGCDGVILLGGGAALDVGKCIALLADNPGTVFDYEDVGTNYEKADGGRIPPMIAVPTTSGTGSEVGRASVIVNPEHEKKIIFHPQMQPPVVLADPELTFELPPHLTAFTGMDAFIHCFEAFCARGYHPMADGIALEGMRLIANNLPRAFEQGDDAEARTHMMMASSMGATAFQKGLGIVHAISHALGGRFDVHHGKANAMLLPYCMVYNRPEIEGPCTTIARHLGFERPSFEALLSWVLGMRKRLGVPETLEAVPGLDRNAFSALCPVALADPSLTGNPRPAESEDIATILENALTGQI